MNKEEAKAKIAELSSIIENHNYNYYVLANPTISDYDFDMLLNELVALEQQFPELILPDSPTQRVGGDITKEFQTVKHRYPMLSLSNSYNIEEVKEFISRIKKTIEEEVEFVCELKFDGISISLTYENGLFVKAVTRGDGTQGDDVTANVKTIRTIPLRLKGDYPDFFEMRGEIIMPHSSFNAINAERDDLGLQPFANPRNAAAGTIKLQDSKEVAKRKLDQYCYFMMMDEDKMIFKNHYESLMTAKEWGFNVSNFMAKCNNVEEIDYSKLPNKFVAKTTDGGGGNQVLICKDKHTLSEEVFKERLRGWMSARKVRKQAGREWAYENNYPRRIIIEELIGADNIKKDLCDYKFFCFNGEPHYCQLIQDRSTEETIDFYDMEWNHMPFRGLNPQCDSALYEADKPEDFEQMKDIAQKLSKGFPFVRVDLYSVKEGVYFGELTFYPASGYGHFTPDEWDEKIGEMLTIPSHQLLGGG